jgi:hypothetical protein
MVVVSACKDMPQPFLYLLIAFVAMMLVGAFVIAGVWFVYRMAFPWGIPIPFTDSDPISPQYYGKAVRHHYLEFICSISGVTVLGIAQVLIGSIGSHF